MNKNNILISFSICLLLVFSIFYFYRYSKKTTINVASIETNYQFKADDLVSNFITDEKNTTKKCEGNVIEIEGKVKEVSFLNETNTVILIGNNNSGIICDFGKNQTKEIKALTKNETVKIKGICKGFLKDVILLNCMLQNTKTNE